ncbi:MAG: ferritin-like domain-containing protein, partial [Pseudomonadota bacterium]
MTSPALKVAPTQNDPEVGLSEQQRAKLADGLSKVLGDTYTLLIKSHAVHWNVVGPLFLPVHELTEQHYNDLFAAADVIAERIRALGYFAPVAGFTGPSETSVPMTNDT